MADPWLVTPGERAKHEEQFNTLRPVGGFITGEQAKGFFLQSRLPPPVLGIIWALSDVDGDGKMDLHEFSIACKLINLKLRGFNLPQTLPASLKQSACGGTAVTATPFPGVGTSMGPGTSTVGVVAGVGVAGLTGLDSGLSVTPARAPGPVVSPMVISASVLPPAAPISAPVPVAPVSVPAVPAPPSTAAAPPVAAIPPLTAAPSNLTSSMPGTLPRSIPDMAVGSTAAAVPGAIPCMVSGVMSGSVAGSIPGIVSGPTAGAGQSSVVPSVPTAVPPAHDPVAVAAGAYVSPVGASPAAPPPGGIMTGGTTVRPMQPMVSGMAPQMVPAQPLVPAAPSSITPTSMAATCVAPVSMVAPSIASAPLVPTPMVPPIAPVSQAVPPNIAQPVQGVSMCPPISSVGGVSQVSGSGAPVAAALPPGTSAAPAGAAVQRTGSQDSGGAQTPGEWAVPQGSKLKFTQVFNMSDRAKTGYLSGVQARNILIQSHLPQQTLAQIWALSDVDNDGRLSCEEFVLAMYLCETAKAGNKLPTVLPADLIPPTNRRQRTSSVHSTGSGGTPVADVLGSINENTFEDKRRENFEKGQAELERRRKALLDAQRRETEERLRREREEEAKREKARQEAERRRQEELEREMHRQRELEAQREQERKRQEELREQARKDAELQRQQEWEKQRLQELMNVRQRQQENLLSLKAKNQSLTIELTTKEDRVKELTQKISETRQGVTEVKATIDTMRSTRDTFMSDMNQLKAAARDQNQRLLALNQEKARLKARNTAAAGASGAEQAAVDASLTSKQMVIKQLQEKVEELEKEVSTKEEDVNNNISDLSLMKEDMRTTAERCAQIYIEYSSKRKEVMSLREKLLNPDAAWGDAASSTWAGKGFGSGGASAWNSAWPPSQPKDAWPSSRADGSGAPTSYPQPLQEQQQHAAEHQPPARPPPPSTTTTTTTTTTMPLMAATGTVKEKPAVPPAPRVEGFNTNSTTISNNTSAVGWGVHNTTPPSSSTTTTAPWGVFSTTTTTTTTTTTPSTTSTTHPDEPETKAASIENAVVVRRRALYQFDARSHDEISFMPGDIIVVTMHDGVEPGWLGGELQGQTGWFPEAYTEPFEETGEPETATESLVRTQLENIPEEGVSTAGAQQKTMGEAVGVFPWRAKQRNHLSFNKGDRITVREKQDQWWYGELNNVGGWFPRSFVRMVSGPTAVTSPVTTPQEAPEEPPMPDNLVHDEVSEFYQALYPYQSGEPGDLTFNAGEIILVVKKEGDWWHGIINQNCGIFPSNYVERLQNQFITSTGDSVVEQTAVLDAMKEQVTVGEKKSEAEQQVVATGDYDEEQTKPAANPATVQTPDSANLKVNQEVMELAKSPKSPKGSKGKKPEIASVLAPYDATSSNQLSLQRGQLVMIRKKTASGWWEGELQAKGKKRQIGWFPATYVKVLGGSSRSTPVSMELTNREDAPPNDVQTPPSAPTSVTQVTITPPTDEPMKGPNDASNGFAEQVEALYPYTAMNDDELTFEAGAIISVIDKEDAAWWKGTLEGAIGVFPSNYVQPYTGVSSLTNAGTPDGEDSLC